MKYDIRNCENAIENLDLRHQVERHNLWPPLTEVVEEEESEINEIEDIQKKQESYLEDIHRLELCIQVCLLSLSIFLF